MGIYSTLKVSRVTALNTIQSNLEEATDEQLSSILFALFGEDKLLNFTVVDSGKDCPGCCDDDEYVSSWSLNNKDEY